MKYRNLIIGHMVAMMTNNFRIERSSIAALYWELRKLSTVELGFITNDDGDSYYRWARQAVLCPLGGYGQKSS